MARVRKTASQIERMYDSGETRVTQERSDFLLPQIRDFVVKEKWMNLRPEYQRRLVWDQKKKSLFIESLLMNVPVPPVFLYESDLNRYEVMDGQQRLNAILEFYEDRLVLKGLDTWSVLNGLRYSQCPPRIRAGLDRRRISANVLLAESMRRKEDADFIRRTVFERLNTGGQELNHQELRNSLYPGLFNDLLIALAKLPLFRRIWDIQSSKAVKAETDDDEILEEPAENKLYQRMLDCQIVLRFFAFRNPTQIHGSVRRILDECMASNRTTTALQIRALRKSFIDALETSVSIFSPRTFQVRDDKGSWRTSRPLFDAVMVGVDQLIDRKDVLIRHRKAISDDLLRELKRRKTYEIIVGKPNTADAVKMRIKILSNLLKRHT
jgi:hypothetical protein